MEDLWRFDINFIEVLKVPVSTLVDVGLMEVPCIYIYLYFFFSYNLNNGILMEIPWRIYENLI